MENMNSQLVDEIVVSMPGHLKESVLTDLEDYNIGAVGPTLLFDCSEIARIESSGLVRWMRLLWTVRGRRHIEFHGCPPVLVTWMIRLPILLEIGEVASLFAPFSCDDCRVYSEVLVTAANLESRCRLEKRCHVCGNPMSSAIEVEDYARLLGCRHSINGAIESEYARPFAVVGTKD